MTLTEFLLARIDEDEADRVARPRKGYLPTPREIREAKRWEAECEAKRRIVAEVEPYSCKPDACPGASREDSILGFLAQPYADHPEFNPEWAV